MRYVFKMSSVNCQLNLSDISQSDNVKFIHENFKKLYQILTAICKKASAEIHWKVSDCQKSRSFVVQELLSRRGLKKLKNPENWSGHRNLNVNFWVNFKQLIRNRLINEEMKSSKVRVLQGSPNWAA